MQVHHRLARALRNRPRFQGAGPRGGEVSMKRTTKEVREVERLGLRRVSGGDECGKKALVRSGPTKWWLTLTELPVGVESSTVSNCCFVARRPAAGKHNPGFNRSRTRASVSCRVEAGSAPVQASDRKHVCTRQSWRQCRSRACRRSDHVIVDGPFGHFFFPSIVDFFSHIVDQVFIGRKMPGNDG